MRVIGEIPHPSCKITLFQWNQKYIIKIEQGPLEQSYKVDETEVIDEAELKSLLNNDFMQSVMQRFHQMHMDLMKAMENM